MANFDFRIPVGWNQWDFLDPTKKGLFLHDSAFENGYTPANGFWIKSILSHCLVTFLVPFDPLNLFVIAGGTLGGVSGALAGLAAAARSFVFPPTIQLGIGHGTAPSLGYCIGDLFKQNVYLKIAAEQSIGFALVTEQRVELLQNSKFKRIYVDHGEIVNYFIEGDKHIISIGIDKTGLPSSLDKEAVDFGLMTITSSDGLEEPVPFNVQILDVLDDWTLEISEPENTNLTGSFYKLNQPWCIEDPFLMSGYWLGSEEDGGTDDEDENSNSSGQGFYKTTYNKPHESGSLLGVYVWGNVAANSTSVTVNESDEAGPIIDLVDISVPVSGVAMNSQFDKEWTFYGFGNSDLSKVYPNDVRYKEVITESEVTTTTTTIEGTTTTTTTLLESTIEFPETAQTTTSAIRFSPSESSLEAFAQTNKTHYRVELSGGGRRGSDNYYSPCLKNEYIISNDKYFKILEHVEFNIVDVSSKSIDGITDFDPINNREYSIVNQKAWMINEHYDNNISGIFGGRIASFESDFLSNTATLEIVAEGDSSVAWYNYSRFAPSDDSIDSNSFIERYKNIHIHKGIEPIQVYDKFQDWKLVHEGTSYAITDIIFPEDEPTQSSQNYRYTVEITTSLTEMIGEVFVSFDSIFETFGSFSSQSGYSFDAVSSFGLSDATLGQIRSDIICFDGGYTSNPYKLTIPSGIRVGFTEGIMFGLDIDRTAQNSTVSETFITTPTVVRGTSFLYYPMKQEGWALYEDPNSNNMVLRRGALDFRENPSKTEIAIGVSSLVEEVDIDGSSIFLNGGQDRLNKLVIPMEDFVSGKTALKFGVGEISNIYGFSVSGDGGIDLQMLRREGVNGGETDVLSYVDLDGEPISPIYLYKRAHYQDLKTLTLEIGIDVNEGPVRVIDGVVESAKAEYVNNNQVIKDPGFFKVLKSVDGETFIIYSNRNVGEFNLAIGEEDVLNNSEENESKWDGAFGIMITGSNNDAANWGTPIKKSPQDPVFQYPLMIANSCEFIDAIYNRGINAFILFLRCVSGNNDDYIGCLIISLNMLSHSNLLATNVDFEDNDPGNTPLSFLWRPPLLSDEFKKDETKFWTNNKSIVNDGFTYDSSDAKGLIVDEFVRIVGDAGTGSQVTYDGLFGVTSTAELNNGIYIFFYDTSDGVKAIFSNTGGIRWSGNDVIYGLNSSSGSLIGEYFFWISSEGINVKLTSQNHFNQSADVAFKKSEGNNVVADEESVQDSFNAAATFLIGSGSVETQRLSGYVTSEGITKVFFYDSQGKLKCMQSDDGSTWKVASNF